MIFCGKENLERLYVHPNNDLRERHWVDIVTNKDEPTFTVTCCCDEEWVWEFVYSSTNYEVVKYLIMGCIAECDTIDELIDMMDECFEEDCWDMIVDEAELQDGEIECDGDCANCKYEI